MTMPRRYNLLTILHNVAMIKAIIEQNGAFYPIFAFYNYILHAEGSFYDMGVYPFTFLQ
jgi:hypothetical protein